MGWASLDMLHGLLCWLCYPLRWSRWGRARMAFERARDPRSFIADWSFEVSSEGEFEQVRPWLRLLLDQGQKVELLFASPSVEASVRALQRQHPQQVRLFPLPLLGHTPGLLARELTAPRLVLCRYDFFPALMARAQRPEVKSGVVWASFTYRRARLERPWWRAFYRALYGVFDWIQPATAADAALFSRLARGTVLPAMEMRVPQILARLARREETLRAKFPHWESFQTQWHRLPRAQRWVLGSFWQEDLPLLESHDLQEAVKTGRMSVVLVPHQLGEGWRARLEAYGMPVHEVSERWAGEELPAGLWLVNLKGVLCELYADAGVVYVGGGFGRSVHSVMEPYVAGATVLCGPAVSRSTEVEMVREVSPEALTVVPDRAALRRAYEELRPVGAGLTQRESWLDNQQRRLTSNLAEAQRC